MNSFLFRVLGGNEKFFRGDLFVKRSPHPPKTFVKMSDKCLSDTKWDEFVFVLCFLRIFKGLFYKKAP